MQITARIGSSTEEVEAWALDGGETLLSPSMSFLVKHHLDLDHIRFFRGTDELPAVPAVYCDLAAAPGFGAAPGAGQVARPVRPSDWIAV